MKFNLQGSYTNPKGKVSLTGEIAVDDDGTFQGYATYAGLKQSIRGYFDRGSQVNPDEISFFMYPAGRRADLAYNLQKPSNGQPDFAGRYTGRWMRLNAPVEPGERYDLSVARIDMRILDSLGIAKNAEITLTKAR